MNYYLTTLRCLARLLDIPTRHYGKTVLRYPSPRLCCLSAAPCLKSRARTTVIIWHHGFAFISCLRKESNLQLHLLLSYKEGALPLLSYEGYNLVQFILLAILLASARMKSLVLTSVYIIHLSRSAL